MTSDGGRASRERLRATGLAHRCRRGLLCLALVAAPGSFALAAGPFAIAGVEVQPGTRQRLQLAVSETFGGVRIETPVDVLHGSEPGPVVCLTGGVHGDEINGVEIVRRSVERLDPATLRATVVAVPIVNVPAFRRASRYLPDRRDLNRAFPGSPTGSMAARIAHRLFEDVVRHCTRLVDVHSGSSRRVNLPQVRADMRDRETAALARALEPLVIVHRIAGKGTLRQAALERGVAAVTVEVGEANRLDAGAISTVVGAILALLDGGPGGACGAAGAASAPSPEAPCAAPSYFSASSWLRAEAGGVFIARVRLGERVTSGQLLGAVTDPASGERSELRANAGGVVIGQAVDQVVMPGFALLHIATDPVPLANEP